MSKIRDALLHPEMRRDRVALRLTALRSALDLTPAQMADAIGHDRSSYSKVESAKEGLSLRYAQRICDLYGVGLDYLFRADFSDLPEHLEPKVRALIFSAKR